MGPGSAGQLDVPVRLNTNENPYPSTPSHVRIEYGRDPHHIAEAQYKAVARALWAAVELDPRVGGVPSTRGVL